MASGGGDLTMVKSWTLSLGYRLGRFAACLPLADAHPL